MRRKQTRYDLCATHQPYFAGMTRDRKAEMFTEGGPSVGPPCSTDDKGHGCRIFPGTDLFHGTFIDQNFSTAIAKDWKVNR